jgi:hypothetical protein
MQNWDLILLSLMVDDLLVLLGQGGFPASGALEDCDTQLLVAGHLLPHQPQFLELAHALDLTRIGKTIRRNLVTANATVALRSLILLFRKR